MRRGVRLVVAGAAFLCGCGGPSEQFDRIQIGRPVPAIHQAWSRSGGSYENVVALCDAAGRTRGKFLLTYLALGAPKRPFDGPPAPGTVRPELCRSLPLVLTCRFRGVMAVNGSQDIAGLLLREAPPPLGSVSVPSDGPEPRLQFSNNEPGQQAGVITLHESSRTGLWASFREITGGRVYLEGFVYTLWPTDQGPLAQELVSCWLRGVGSTEYGGVNPHDLETLRRAMARLTGMAAAADAASAVGEMDKAEAIYGTMYVVLRYIPIGEQ